jgi:hypothetical protein
LQRDDRDVSRDVKDRCMGVREALNRNPAITTGATAGLIVVALGFIIWTTFGGNSGGGYDPHGKVFFTADDGATYFVDSADKCYTPPKLNGKDSLYAHVFSCDGKKFVGYLERISADAATALAAHRSAPDAKGPSVEGIIANGREVRRPKEVAWVKANTDAGAVVIEVKCPDGKSYASEVSANQE